MKIVMIPEPFSSPVTGGEIYNSKLYEYLSNNYQDVTTLSFHLLRFEAKTFFKRILFGLGALIRNMMFFWRILRFSGKTVLIEDIYWSTDLFICNYLVHKFKKNVKISVIVHHLYYLISSKMEKRLMKIVEATFLNQADLVIVNSEHTKMEVLKIICNKNKEIVTAYPGVDKGKINKNKYFNNKHIIDILFVGSITPRKNIKILLDCISILVYRLNISNIKLHLVGSLDKDHKYSSSMMNYAKNKNLCKYVTFHGSLDAATLRKFYSIADIFVLASSFEGFGMVLAEAMMNRIPIVATRAGAISELIKDGKNGLLVPLDSPQEMACAIKKLIDSPKLRKKMGEHGGKIASDFDWEKSFKKIKNCVERLYV